jgi:hypothetical protein
MFEMQITTANFPKDKAPQTQILRQKFVEETYFYSSSSNPIYVMSISISHPFC